MNDVASVLKRLGYGEVRLNGGEWVPLSTLNGELGTTDETEIRIPSSWDHRVRLVDAETEKPVGRARKACSLPRRDD
jgi:hypothetical protein